MHPHSQHNAMRLTCGLRRRSHCFRAAALLSLLTMMATRIHAAENVEITAELDSFYPSGTTTNHFSVTVTCVVSTNNWFIKGNFLRNADAYFWLIGTNVVEHRVITDSMYLQRAKDFVSEKFPGQKPRHTRVVSSYPLAGQTSTRVHPSPQGELAGEGIENAVWLAFCSGTYLKHDGRQIPMPLGRSSEALEYSDKTIVFKDDLGLPKSVEMCATNGQLVCEYKVLQATNFLGRTFPLKFSVAQFCDRPASGGTTIRSRSDLLGRVTLIKIGTQPEVPKEVRAELENVR
jgi:hypothetical protein